MYTLWTVAKIFIQQNFQGEGGKSKEHTVYTKVQCRV